MSSVIGPCASPPRPPDRAGALRCDEMQACPGCGATTTESGRFCPACGAVLVAPGPAQASTAVLPAADTSPSRPPPASLGGRTIGDFAIEGVIGSGSFGKGYRGRQLGLDRPAAVKGPG